MAVGGSIVADARNWEMLGKYARTVWLQASPEAHLSRVQSQGDLRPMIGHNDALGKIRQILTLREPLYAQADFVIQTEDYGIQGSIDQIVSFYRKSI